MRRRLRAPRARRQLLAGLVVVPLSMAPFMAYGALTPQGRLLADQISVRLDPPELPSVSPAEADRLRAAQPDYQGAVMPLVYHGVGSDTAAEGDLAVTPEQFAEHLAVLRAAGMHFVTASEVAAAFSGSGPPLPDRAVLITFDDGRSDAVLWATPLLRAAGAKATMFVITGQTDDHGSPYYASWDDLDPDVWDVQSHTDDLHREQSTATATYPMLTSRADGETLVEWFDRVQRDLDVADAAIEEHTGRRPVAFAYPFGAWGADRTNDPDIGPMLRSALRDRYELAFHQDGQEDIVLAWPLTPATGIRRLSVGDWTGAELLDRIAEATERSEAFLPSG